MKLRLEPADDVFRQEVRTFIAANLPDKIRRRARAGMHPIDEVDRRWWNGVLHERGWSAPHWPVEYGGTGWSPIRQHIFELECRLANTPELRWQGLRLIGPVLWTYGSPEQKARYLPRILKGDEQWAQGFSEPGAGSDLAALKTSAILDGDHYVVNGQKVWTTEGLYCEQGFFLVRTDATGKPQAGISMLIIDMKTPGVTVRPLDLIHGGQACAEIFLQDVRVPASNIIGRVNDGWSQAKFLLGHERTTSSDIHKSHADLNRIRRIARTEMRDGRRLIDDPVFRRKLSQLQADVNALEWSVLRVLFDAPGEYVSVSASLLKLKGSELQQTLSDLAVEALGRRGLRFYPRDELLEPTLSDFWPDHVPGATADHLYLRGVTIYGGAREVQKNIIAKLAFGV